MSIYLNELICNQGIEQQFLNGSSLHLRDLSRHSKGVAKMSKKTRSSFLSSVTIQIYELKTKNRGKARSWQDFYNRNSILG